MRRGRGEAPQYALPSRAALSDQTDFALTALHFGGDGMWIWRTARWCLRRWRRATRMARLVGQQPEEAARMQLQHIRKAEREADRAAVQGATGRQKVRDGVKTIGKVLQPVRALMRSSIFIDVTDAGTGTVLRFDWDRHGTVAQVKAKLLEDLAVYAMLDSGGRRRVAPDELRLTFGGESLEPEPEPEQQQQQQQQPEQQQSTVADIVTKYGLANADALIAAEAALADHLVQLYSIEAMRDEGTSLVQEILEVWTAERLHAVMLQLLLEHPSREAWAEISGSGGSGPVSVREVKAAFQCADPARALARLLLRVWRQRATVELRVVKPRALLQTAEDLHEATSEELERDRVLAAELRRQTGEFALELSGELAAAAAGDGTPGQEADDDDDDDAISGGGTAKGRWKRGVEKLRRVRSEAMFQLRIAELDEHWLTLAEELFERCVRLAPSVRYHPTLILCSVLKWICWMLAAGMMSIRTAT
jgi:hypothetical protein